MHCILAKAVERFSDSPYLISGNTSLTFKECDRRVDTVIGSLKKYGLKPGDRIGLYGKNSLEYIIALHAVMRAGMIAVPLPVRMPQKWIMHYLQDINCTYVIADSNLEITANDVTYLGLSDIVTETSTTPSQQDQSVPLAGQRKATIIPTSGSTGQPKVVVHSYENHYKSALGSNSNSMVNPSDRWLLSLPLYHIGGVAILFRTALAGASIVVPGEQESEAAALKKYHITHLSLVPTQLYRLLDEELDFTTMPSLKAVLLGGGAPAATLVSAAVQAGIPLFTSYGSTEMASQITATQTGDNADRLKSSGKILPYRELKIEQNNEIYVKGDTLAQGYLHNEQIRDLCDNNGWFHTGDLGYIDKDGYVTILGRKDTMFISGGENIYPEEIEQVLMQKIDVKQAIVVPYSNKEYGERPVAFILKHKEQIPSKEEFVSLLEHNLPRFKFPDYFFPWPEDVKQHDVKVDRHYFAKIVGEYI